MLANAPFLIFPTLHFPRLMLVRRRVVEALQALGHSVILDRSREFLCSTKNVSIPAVTLTTFMQAFPIEITNLHIVDAKAKTKWNKSKAIGGCGYRFGHALPPDLEGIGEDNFRLQLAKKQQSRLGLQSIDSQYLDDLRDDKFMLAGVRHIIGCEPEYAASMQATKSRTSANGLRGLFYNCWSIE